MSDSHSARPDAPDVEPARDAGREDVAAEHPSLDPPPSELVGRALGAAVRRAGIDPDADQSTGSVVWRMIGGVRGVVESVLPGLAFLLIYTLAHDLLLALAVSVGLAAVFTVIRLVQRSTPSAAIGGLVATGAAAGIALLTGRAEDNFVLGLITNAAWGTAFLVSALIGWSLIGLAAGFLTDEGVQWRKDARKRRVYFWLAIAWAALFYARLGAQLPFYFSGDVAVLGTVKLIMGIPLFAVLVALTWFAVRAVTRTSDE